MFLYFPFFSGEKTYAQIHFLGAFCCLDMSLGKARWGGVRILLASFDLLRTTFE